MSEEEHGAPDEKLSDVVRAFAESELRGVTRAPDQPPTLEDIAADLGGLTEVADDLAVGLHRVKRWVERRPSTGCPLPVRRLKMGDIYSLAHWRGWFALWRITRGSETWTKDKPVG